MKQGAPFTYHLFKGSVPRLAEHLVQHSAGFSSTLIDGYLERGRLQPIREPLKVLTTDPTTQSVWPHDCCWLQFPKLANSQNACISVANGSATCRSIFVTGASPFPVEGLVSSDCSVAWKRLGLPCPQIAPTFTVLTERGQDKDIEGRTYAFAYVNSRNSVGQLSPADTPLLIKDGSTVRVAGWPVPAVEWDIVKVKIFRTVSGALSPFNTKAVQVEANAEDTSWMYVGEVPIATTYFDDSRPNEDLTIAHEWEYMPAPPEDLQAIGYIESMNILFGFKGRELYFSENGNYDAWPHKYTLDDNIKDVVESGLNIYVSTDGHPYVISADEDCEHAGCRAIVRCAVSAPQVGNGPRHMAAVPGGAVYPTHKGLALITGAGQVKIITENLYSPDQWQELQPHTIIPVNHLGHLFAFGAIKSFVICTANGPEAWDLDTHVELSDRVIDAIESRDGFLYLHKDDGVYQWEGGTTYREFMFKSGTMLSPYPVSYGAFSARVVPASGSVTFKIWQNNRAIWVGTTSRNRRWNLPSWTEGDEWFVTAQGTGTVSGFSMGPTATGVQL